MWQIYQHISFNYWRCPNYILLLVAFSSLPMVLSLVFYVVPQGDHVTFLNIYKGFHQSGKSSQWCYKNFLNHQALVCFCCIKTSFFLIKNMRISKAMSFFFFFVAHIHFEQHFVLFAAEEGHWNQGTACQGNKEVWHTAEILRQRYAGRILPAFLTHRTFCNWRSTPRRHKNLQGQMENKKQRKLSKQKPGLLKQNLCMLSYIKKKAKRTNSEALRHAHHVRRPIMQR